MTPSPVMARPTATRQSLDRFVPRDDENKLAMNPTPVMARPAATRQSLDRFVPRDNENKRAMTPSPVKARRLATWQSLNRFVLRGDENKLGKWFMLGPYQPFMIQRFFCAGVLGVAGRRLGASKVPRQLALPHQHGYSALSFLV